MFDPWVRSMGWEDPLEEGMATGSSILTWKIPWTEEPGGLQSTGSQSRTQLSGSHHFKVWEVGEEVFCSTVTKS